MNCKYCQSEDVIKYGKLKDVQLHLLCYKSGKVGEFMARATEIEQYLMFRGSALWWKAR